MARRRSGPEILAAAGDLVVQRDAGRASGRLLRHGDMDASYVDLADPRHLEFDYLRRMRDLVEAVHARRVIHVGGGAGALARALAASDRQRRQDVGEVDPDGLAFAREPLPPRRDGSADAILVDAFVGARVPRHLVTAEALADAARVLAPGGALAVNVVDAPPLNDARAIAAGLLEACP